MTGGGELPDSAHARQENAMTETTAQENMERSHQAHWIPERKISMDNMRGYRFAKWP